MIPGGARRPGPSPARAPLDRIAGIAATAPRGDRGREAADADPRTTWLRVGCGVRSGPVPAGAVSTLREMDLGLDGCGAIVLGASQGMGLAIAEALAGEGAQVVMAARRADVLACEAARIGATAVAVDLTEPEDRSRLVEAALDAMDGRIDVLVLNGGGPAAGPAATMTPDAVRAAVELLLVPHVDLVGLCLPHLRAGGRGRIVAV